MECADKPEANGAAIKVIGVGGGGNNASNSLIQKGLNGVVVIAANTDILAFERYLAGCKIQLGSKCTKGLGANGDPQLGRRAAIESLEQIKAAIGKASVVVVVAGMGGGTGTGAAPVIAQTAKEMGALTVGVVTRPFSFEGTKRHERAEAGITALREYVDSLVIIPNDNLLQLAPKKASFAEALDKAHEVLDAAVKSIAELIAVRGIAKLDSDEVKTALSGLAGAHGEALSLMAQGGIEGEPPGSAQDEFKTAEPCLAVVQKDGMALQRGPEKWKQRSGTHTMRCGADIEETLLSLQCRKNEACLRKEVMEALQASLSNNYDLYQELAK